MAYYHSPPAPQNPNTTRVAQHILNDTSLAAISLPNGDRQLFFQDNTGLIRHAIRTGINGQWNTSSYLNISSNPENNTPLVAFIPPQYPDNIGPQVLFRKINNVQHLWELIFEQITLYYVSESHVLNASAYFQVIWMSFAQTQPLNSNHAYSWPSARLAKTLLM